MCFICKVLVKIFSLKFPEMHFYWYLHNRVFPLLKTVTTILLLLSGERHLLHSFLVITLGKIPPIFHGSPQNFWDVLIQEN